MTAQVHPGVDGEAMVIGDDILTPGEVAVLFSVDPKTVSRWERTGKLAGFRTLGGHRRFHRAVVEAALNERSTTP